MVKIVKNPGNGRLNNLNDPVLNVLNTWMITVRLICFNAETNDGLLSHF